MNVRIDLNEPKTLAKVQNDRFGLLVSNEWKRLIDPYTPRDTGTMQQSAKISPWKIHYIQPYSARIYYGRDFNFQHKNPYWLGKWIFMIMKFQRNTRIFRGSISN